MITTSNLRTIRLIVIVLLANCSSTFSMTKVVFQQSGPPKTVTGRVLVEAVDGGLLFQARDNKIWAIQPNQLVSKSSDDGVPFRLYPKNELKAQILKDLPAGFKVYETAHFMIFYNTSKAYAQWNGALYERLYRAFFNYWRNRRFRLQEPKALVAIVFQDQASFERYARVEMGDSAKSVIGFYSLQTNAITTYDLTGVGSVANGRRATNSRQINALLATPQAERTVATVIHEATHQLVFNSGLQTRFADIPLWLSEGLAIFFETPDLRSRKGWRTIGSVNRVRHAQMLEYLNSRPEKSLRSLVVDDRRFRNARQAESAYAEGWSLTYFLIKYYPKQFHAYLKTLQQKKALGVDTPETRLNDFEAAFRMKLDEMEPIFLKFISNLE